MTAQFGTFAEAAAADRQRLRRTFDRAASRYHRARPDYPEALIDDVVQMAGLRPGDRLLEIGCGTGKATIPLARWGYGITCLELGPGLAAEARANLAPFADVQVRHASFDTWRTPAEAGFDLVFAATTWHWLDPETRYRRAWESLRSGGQLAFWSATHVFPDDADPFFAEIQPVYAEIGEPPGVRRRPGELPDDRSQIEATGLFDDVRIRHYYWEVRYDVESYLALLDTFSGHLELDPDKRAHLYRAICVLLRQRPDGQLRRHWGAVLHVARRLGS